MLPGYSDQQRPSGYLLISFVTDRDTGRSRGLRFVEMTDSEECDKAVAELNGSRTYHQCDEARPKADRSGGRGAVLCIA